MALRNICVVGVQALGVAVDLGPQSVARCVKEAGVGFMFAPRYHPAMAAVRQIRKDLGVSVLLFTQPGCDTLCTLLQRPSCLRISFEMSLQLCKVVLCQRRGAFVPCIL